MIKNILFDFGNVLLDLDFEATEKAFEQASGKELRTWRDEHQLTDMLHAYETGHLSTTAFLQEMKRVLPGSVTENAIIQAWNAMLLDIPAYSLELLSTLRKKYNLYLLSNTNALHLDWVDAFLQHHFSMTTKDWDEQFFIKAYYSHLIGYRKPDTDCYEFVLEDADLVAAETLFVDDVAANTEAAKMLGIQVYTHDPATKLGDQLAQILGSL